MDQKVFSVQKQNVTLTLQRCFDEILTNEAVFSTVRLIQDASAGLAADADSDNSNGRERSRSGS
jgi:predicted protein tyrosine phosphatase